MPNKRQQTSGGSPDEPIDVPREPNVSRFNNLQFLAYGGIFAFFFGIASQNDFFQMWLPPTAPNELAIYVVRMILFIEILILSFRWIIATHHELNMWVDWLENPFTKQEMYAAILGLSVVLGILLAFPHRIVFLSGFMTAYLLLNYWTQWLSNDHFNRALEKTRAKKLSEAKRIALEAMEHFWLKRPQLGRIATQMYIASISFSLAFAGSFQQGPQKHWFYFSAYIVLSTPTEIG